MLSQYIHSNFISGRSFSQSGFNFQKEESYLIVHICFFRQREHFLWRYTTNDRSIHDPKIWSNSNGSLGRSVSVWLAKVIFSSRSALCGPYVTNPVSRAKLPAVLYKELGMKVTSHFRLVHKSRIIRRCALCLMYSSMPLYSERHGYNFT